MRRSVLAALAAATVLVTAGVAGCSASDPARSNPAAAAGGEVAAPAGAPNRPASLTQPADLTTQAKIRTATVNVSVSGSGRAAHQADAAEGVTVGAGGVVDSDDRTSGPYASETLRLRVPPTRLASVLTALARLGHETSREVSSRDVTEQVADVGSRVASAQQAILRLRTLYADAAKVTDVIAIEGELSTREADLEALQARQRTLGRETAMAAVTLYLRTSPPAARHSAQRAGFIGGLSRGWDAFLTGAKGVATGAGAVLPFLAALLVLLIAARLLGVPGLRRRRPGPVPEPAE